MVRVQISMKGLAIRQAGQALVLCLLLAGAAALASLLLFNSGMLANAKTELQNAADAGAYSGAVMLARDHNFSAYSNRAMVANQVAVAQLVSLKSYLQDAASTHSRLNDFWQSLQADIPQSKPAWEAGERHPIENVDRAYTRIASTAVTSIDTLIRAFDTAQHVHHETTGKTVMFVIDEIVKKNSPQAKVSTGAFQAGTSIIQVRAWENDYTQRYRADVNSAVSDRFANTVLHTDSTDGFTRSRLSVPLPAWLSKPKWYYCPLGIPEATAFIFTHSGGTLLSSDKKRWMAMDATMGEGFYTCKYITPWGVYYPTLPLVDPSTSHVLGGSGGAVAGNRTRYGETNGFRGNATSSRFYGYAMINPLTAIPAQVRYRRGPQTNLDTNGGMQENYRDVAAWNRAPANQSPELNGGQMRLTVEVQRDQDSVRTSTQVVGAAPNIRVDPQMKGGTMRSLASAHAFFYRPNRNSSAFTRNNWQRGDRRTEMANLFNPYWQARLIDRTEAERGLSIGFQ